MQLGFSMKLTHLSPVQYQFIHTRRQGYIHSEVGGMLPKLRRVLNQGIKLIGDASLIKVLKMLLRDLIMKI